jgi:subtilase family serine protease
MDINTQRGMIPSLFSLILVLVLFSAVIGIAAAADPIVSIVPSQSSVCVGDDFGVYIQVNPNGNILQMAQVDLAFDSSLVSLTVADGGMFSMWFSAGTQSGDAVTDISGSDPGVTATDNLAVLHMHADSAGTFTLDLSGATAGTATAQLTPIVNDGKVTINVCDSNNCPSDVEFIGTATTDELSVWNVCYGTYHCEVVVDEIISDPDNSIQVGSEYTVGYGDDSKYIKSGDKIKVDGSYYHSCGALSNMGNICGDVDKVGLPDLIIQDISWSPSSPEQGDTVTFTATIKNQGTGDATAFYIYYYVDGSYHAMDTVYSLSAGSTTTETFTWTASKCGNVQVKAVADANNAVSESNEGNNERTETVNVECPDPEPDYIVQDISWSPISPEQGETITFTVTIKNQGDWDDSSFCVYYYIDGSYQDMDTVYGMNTGSTITETFTWTANKCGNVQVKAVADANNVIPESNEGNNERTETVNVECPDPDLIIQDITWSPSSPEQGDAIAFTVTIKNQGAGSAGSSTAKYYIDGSYVTYDSVPALSSGSTSTQTFTWAADRCGNVQVKAVADANNAVSESNEGNNERTETVNVECPDPDLITQDVSWSPSSPEQGDTMTFTVTIKNQGSGSAGSSTAKYYIDGSYVTYDSVPALSAGSTSTQTFTWTANKCGNVQVKAVADANNAVSESNEGNNERTETVNVDCLEEIKFNGTAIEYFSLIGAWGWYVSVDEIISGPSELQDHTVKVYLASVNPDQYPPGYMDPTIEPGDKVGVYGWYQGYDIVSLFGSEDYYIKKISPTPKPDLVIDPITYSPSNPQKDEIVTFTVKIKNQGAGSAGSSMVKYYIDGSYITYDSVPALSAGSTSTQTFIWTANKCGTIQVKGVADATNVVPESNEGNNERTETVSIICQADLPDLIIQDITWSPSSPEQGDTVVFTVNIKNQGTEDAISFYVYYIVDGSSYTYDGISGLPAGSISTQTFTWVANKCGTIPVKGVADATNLVPEGNEGNNERTETVSITCQTDLPDLIIQDITWSPSSPEQGDTVVFTVKIKNQGSVSTETSSTVNYYIGNSPVNSDSVPALVAGETSTQTFIWTANKCGNIQVKAVADANNAVSEGDERNNERRETVSINCPSGSLTVTIYPSGVRTDARWKLTAGPDTSWHSSGDTITSIPVGSYTIQFNDVSGWTKPSDMTITINEGSNSESGTYTQNPGSLTVTIYPSGVRTDARWKLTAGPDTSWHSSGDTITSIPVGSYTIQFNDVSGWTKPSDMTITINEGSNSESETYTQNPGSLTVTIYPSGVRTDARWKLTSGPDTSWHSSGDTVSNIPVGSRTIQFNDVTGWTKPSDIPITINEGSNSDFGRYTQKSGSLTVTIYPSEVRSQAGWRLISGPDISWHYSGDTVSNIPVDSYTIQFTDISGWTKPSDIAVTINEGSNSESGRYTQKPGSLTVTINPSEVRSQARWRLTSGLDTSWHSSGDTVSNIPVDSYTIQFNDISGWTKPSDIAVTINEGSNSEYETYTSKGEVDAEFYDISSWPEGVYKPCRVIQPTVWVKNTGDVTHEFFVSMYIENWDNPKKNYTEYGPIIVDPGRFKGVELSWEVPSDAIGGFYRVVFLLLKTRVTNDEFEGEGELDGEVYDPFRIANGDYEHFATIADNRSMIMDALIVRYSTQEEKDIEEEWNKELRYMVSEGWDEAQKGLSVDPKSGHPFIDGAIELCGLLRLGHEAQKGTDTYT